MTSIDDNSASDRRSGWIEQFLHPGDALRSGGSVPLGRVGVRLTGNIELTDRPGVLARLGRELYERFSRNTLPEGAADPQVIIVGDPAAELRFLATAPGADNPDGYREARTRLLDEVGEPRSMAPLHSVSNLRPVDGDDRPPAPMPSAADALIERAEALGVDSGELDDLVHDLASRQASAINNAGLDAQIRYLVEQLGPAEAQAEVETATG